MRNKKMRLIENELEQMKGKIQETLTNGKALQQDDRSQAHPLFLAGLERQLKVAEAFLSESCSVTQNEEGKPSVSLEPITHPTDLTPAPGVGWTDAFVQRSLDSCEYLPMESKDLPCMHTLMANLKRAQTLIDPAALERYEGQHQGHKELLKQMHKSFLTAFNDLKNSIGTAAKRKLRDEENEKERGGEEAQGRSRSCW